MILRHIKINFDSNRVLARDHRAHTGNCLLHLRTEMADLYQPLGGLPDGITPDNTTIHQLWWTDQDLDFEDLGRQLGMQVLSVSSICQAPGCVIPWHRDSFFRIRSQIAAGQTVVPTVVRANIHLKPAAIGHFVQYEFNHELITHTGWVANEGILWDSEVSHLGANVGFEDKYTLQVSGILN